jgi:hypothetical protein
VGLRPALQNIHGMKPTPTPAEGRGRGQGAVHSPVLTGLPVAGKRQTYMATV